MAVTRKTKASPAGATVRADTEPASTGPASTGPASTGPAGTGPDSTVPASTGPASTGPAEGATPAERPAPSERRADVVRLAGQLFARKGYRATTVREIADAAGILSGSLYHHFDSKESIADEILSGFMNEILTDYHAALAAGGPPRQVLEQIVRSTSKTLARHRAALAMLQNDWSYFATQPRFSYLRAALAEVERAWITQLDRGIADGTFRGDLDPKLTYRLLRDVLWIPAAWRQSGGYATDQVVDAFLRLLFDGISAPAAT